jgi:transposase InsO family protein
MIDNPRPEASLAFGEFECLAPLAKPHRTAFSDKTAPCPLDRVNRQFRAPRPNVLWVSDFTYFAT